MMSQSPSKTCIYTGHVFHKRYTPRVHALRYKVFNLYADLDTLPRVAEKLRLFSLNRFNLFSFYDRDHGDPAADRSSGLKERLIRLLNENNIQADDNTQIAVLTYPRVFGFAFNPLSVFICSDSEGHSFAVIYEVRNTFGERHNYIYEVPKSGSMEDIHCAEKVFHVSPFFDRQGNYRFRLLTPGKKVSVKIDYIADEQKRLTAAFSGSQEPLTDWTLLKLAVSIPFMTLKVVGGILFEAARLWLKGLKIYSHSERHEYQSTLIAPESRHVSVGDTQSTKTHQQEEAA